MHHWKGIIIYRWGCANRIGQCGYVKQTKEASLCTCNTDLCNKQWYCTGVSSTNEDVGEGVGEENHQEPPMEISTAATSTRAPTPPATAATPLKLFRILWHASDLDVYRKNNEQEHENEHHDESSREI